VYTGGAAYSMLSIRTEFNLPFDLAFKYLTVPFLAASVLFVLKRPELFFKSRDLEKWRQLLFAIMLGGFLTLISGPYVALANALLPPQRTIIVEGHIIEKFLAGKHGESSVIVLDTKNAYGKPYRFELSRKAYERTQIGDRYRNLLRQGGLGFVYKWRQQRNNEAPTR